MARIGYRRMSGAIGITQHEHGTRGLWWEKRRALVAWLTSRGHQVDWVGRMTKFSQQARDVALGPQHSHLIVEFGSANRRFYGPDLDQTQALASAHVARGGRVVFVCDDPDLPYLWGNVPAAERGAWAVWANMAQPQAFGGQPSQIPTYDLPVHALAAPLALCPAPPPTPAAYIGRPGGRMRAVRQLVGAQVDFCVYGRAAEWAAFPQVQVRSAPQQPQRAEFYARQSAALVLADAKHKHLGWRTGRAYHALAAGCPPLVEADHAALTRHMQGWNCPSALAALIKDMQHDPAARRACIESARSHAWGPQAAALAAQAAEAVGL